MPPDSTENSRKKSAFAYVFERFPTFTQTFCFREVLAVRQQGVDPQIYSIRTPKEEPFQDFPEELQKDTCYVPQDLRTALKKCSKDIPFKARVLLAAWRLVKRIPDRHRAQDAAWLGTRLRADGVRHVHSHFAGVGARVIWWLKKFYGIDYSFTAHANDVFCAEVETPVTREKLFRDAKLVVTVSDYSLRFLQEKYPFAASKIHRVYNGMNLDRFEKSNPDAANPLILTIGRYIPKKGFLDLIDACAALKDRTFICQIIGQGPMEEELKQRVAAHGLEGKVEITGPRSESEIIALLRKTAIFALPCIDAGEDGKDNLPTVIMEAMAASVPVVSTPVAGVPEMVVDGETGYLIPEKNSQVLAEKLRLLLDDPAEARKMGEKGRVHAEENFALHKTSAMLCELWRKYGALS
ncbi:MAG: glycosyltransferase family 4 protein [Chthoniobacterales bacterium]